MKRGIVLLSVCAAFVAGTAVAGESEQLGRKEAREVVQVASTTNWVGLFDAKVRVGSCKRRRDNVIACLTTITGPDMKCTYRTTVKEKPDVYTARGRGLRC